MKQYIEPLPGFIPVYIRPGDTPLEEINADLAEAFESYAIKHGRLPIQSINNNDISQQLEEKKNFDYMEKLKTNNIIDGNQGIHAIQVVIQQDPQHIQKIPRV